MVSKSNPAGSARTMLDLAGPEVSDDVRRLIGRYSAEAVKAEIKIQTRRRPGMPLKGDWKILESFLKEDARLWLECENPFRRGADNSVAAWYAKNHPDENVQPESTYKRVYRKLRKDRRYYALVEAYWMSEAGCSYQKHLETLKELCSASKIDSGWQAALERAEGTVSDYRIKLGCLPPSEMTIRDVEDATKALIAESERNVLQAIFRRPRRNSNAAE